MPFQLQVTASRRFRPARLLIGEFGSEVFSAPLHFPTIDIVAHVLWLRLVAADSSVGAFGCSPVSKAVQRAEGSRNLARKIWVAVVLTASALEKDLIDAPLEASFPSRPHASTAKCEAVSCNTQPILNRSRISEQTGTC
jgi:hypothetical protein